MIRATRLIIKVIGVIRISRLIRVPGVTMDIRVIRVITADYGYWRDHGPRDVGFQR